MNRFALLRFFVVAQFLIISSTPALCLEALSRDPYVGAIVVDASDGRVLFEDNADAKAYPASMIKLMNLLIILDAVDKGQLRMEEIVTVSAEASRMGGSQVYLKEKETFTVEDLLYAMIVQSANDAALALAQHYAGSREGFVDLMNKKAIELGMKDTVFHSVHGLPPGKNQMPDLTTARDMARLGRALANRPEALVFTSTIERAFRPDATQPFIMRTHNHLLKNFEGCDGLKTGYYSAAGFSIAATAQKKGVRAIAVVMGSTSNKIRDAKAREILSKGLMELVLNAPPPVHAASATVAPAASEPASAADVSVDIAAEETAPRMVMIRKRTLIIAGLINATVILLLAVALVRSRSANRRF
jgi:serine-type D-Ala-D-Ala carboxypeptidase (penicillin-binding protein 5/6)